ncbi:MAG: ABC transporter substrate-binding protein [Lachnospiraceae bacterium]|jgi:peptide/nickel transport system substrate-binding protein|nr:ABC transporter substrate-binding protein [Lachnospiraceae bacterium]
MKKPGMKSFITVLVLLTLAIALSACSGDKKGDDSSTIESVITVGIPQDLNEGLDPHQVEGAGTREVYFNIFEGLVKPDSDGQYNPAVASDYTISEDGSIYTFTLREGVLFHDGTTVTAEDVKYSLDRCANTEAGEPLVEAFSNLRATTIIDEQTIEITLHTPDTEFLASLTAAIIPAANSSPEDNPIGTGPYRFLDRSPQEHFTIERFDQYWGEAAHIQKVIFKVIANMDTVAMELEGGSIDMLARIPFAQAAELSDRFTVMEGTMNLVQALYLNHAKPPFDNLLVRQAMCYAIDPQEIMMMISAGKGVEIGSSMFPAFSKYYLEELKDTYNRDIDKAKQLLTDAGYPDGFSFTMTVPSNHPQHVDTAQVLAEQFKAVGIDARIELIEWSSWLSDVYVDRQFEATVVGVDAAELTARALLERFTSTADNNFINYNNPAYDQAFTSAVASTSDVDKVAYYQECQRILTDDAANVYIQDLPELVALSNRFGGYEFYPLYVQDMAKIYPVTTQ